MGPSLEIKKKKKMHFFFFAGNVVQEVVQRLPREQEALCSDTSTSIYFFLVLDIVFHICNPSIQEVKAGGS
jgi:hypothetical protein